MGLPDKPEETSAATLAALWHLASGHRVSARQAELTPLRQLDREAEQQLDGFIARRLAGEPLAHITGRQSFMGLEMLAEPGALIPRVETEILGRALIAKAEEIATPNVPLLAIDVCTGSGNLAVALARRRHDCRVFAADLSEEACALARRNAELLGVTDRVEVRAGDLLAPFDDASFHGKVDLLSCNPPYISTSRMTGMPQEIIGFEPALAFDGGALGIRVIQKLISDAPRFLRPGGWLLFEVGLGQGPAVENRVNKTGFFREVSTVADENGAPRVIVARSVN
jgi:release factor glutamine methyltransferase